MALRFENVVIDCRDPRALGRWWAETLGWDLHEEPDGEVNVRQPARPDGSCPYPELCFGRDEHPEDGQERVHLDLNSHSLDEQRAIVERLVERGAAHADVGQADDAPFVVLADPEGNHFCVLEPREQFADLGSLVGYTLAAHDAQALRDFWVAATGWDLTEEEPGYVTLTPPGGGPDLEIITRPTMPRGAAKNRIHLDVSPRADDDQDAAVERLLALGGTRVDVGQHAGDPVPWVVLADPEGNEICVLSPRP